ncbi:hypothetical protein PV326_000097 [Microctonus aethiopoides]|nr:hypothetical protein PV326_000097 [Microctonus aethiopoides]
MTRLIVHNVGRRCWLQRRVGVVLCFTYHCLVFWRGSHTTSGLLAALSLLHIIISLLSGRKLNRSGIDSMGESLLNTRPEIYDRFEEVLVTDVLDDVVIGGTTGRLGDSDGEM